MTFEVTVNWHNPIEACEEMRRLDLKFKTTSDSPLHHDNRCGLLHGDIAFEVATETTVGEILHLLEPDPWRQNETS